MRFAHPEWLISLVLIPIIAFVAWLAWKRRGERWKRLVAPRLRGRLSRVRNPWIHFSSLSLALLGLAGLIVAFAQPESGEEWIEIESEGRNILFCIDISRSMLAEDIQPNRLKASRSAALEILEKFPNDRVGVLLFAGRTLVQSPLTLDHGFVEQTLAQLDPADIPHGGSNLSGATLAGVRLLTQTGQKSNIMVVFSDGENSTEGLEDAAGSAAEEGIFIYALGMGTRDGDFIPDRRSRDGKFRDRNGNPVFTRLDESALQTLAESTNGYYSRGIGGGFLGKLEAALSQMDRFQEEGKHQRVAKPAHQWFLFAGILFLMISLFVRCLPLRSACAAALFVLMIPQADADLVEDGRSALRKGAQMEAHQSFKEAASDSKGERAARLHLAAGSAAYHAKSWNAAADSFSNALESNDKSLQQKAHYALANSLFYMGVPLEGDEKQQAWRGAANHFEAALEINPSDQAAAKNLESVRKLLKQTPPEQPQDQDDQEKQQNDPPEKTEENKDQPKDSNETPDDQNEDGESGENENKDSPPSDEPSESDQNEDGGQDQTDQEEDQSPGDSGEEPRDPDKAEQPSSSPENMDENMPNEPGESQDDQSGQEREESNESTKEPEKPKDNSEAKEGNESDKESRAEQARRTLKQFADFGGKPPRRIRRPVNRPAQDW